MGGQEGDVSGTAFVRFRGPVSIHVGARELVCPADRLSLSGIQLYSPVHESAGSFMRLSFELDQLGPLEVDGYLISSVRVKDHHRWHVQFHNVHEQIAGKLVQWADLRATPAEPHQALERRKPDLRRKRPTRETQRMPTVAPAREGAGPGAPPRAGAAATTFAVHAEPAWSAQRAGSETETSPALPAVVLPDEPPRVGVPRPQREEPAFFESDTTPVG